MGLFTPKRKSRNNNLLDKDLAHQLNILNSNTQEQDIEKLKKKVENLSLISKALWEYIREEKGLSDDDLMKKVEKLREIEEKAENCPVCRRVMNINQNKCLYCGTEGDNKGAFAKKS